jgi:hypothetical protein
MLDLDHPMTKHIFAASGMEDFLLVSAQRMTLLPSKERLSLLENCLVVLDNMRRLNNKHFEASSSIANAIDEVQGALEHIAHLNGGSIEEDKTDGEGPCAACGTPITSWETCPAEPWTRRIIFCQQCNEPFMKAKAKLESPEGFGTCFI